MRVRGMHWDLIFCRHLNDLEVDEVEGLFLRLGTKKLILEGMDKPRWEETKNEDFSTKAMYKVLGVGLYSAFPSANIWRVRVQPKTGFFCLGNYLGGNSDS